ncbi:MAG: FecR domain-containing protein [Burkholderiales bacterium]
MISRLLLASLLLTTSLNSLAASDAVVEGVQLPAWLTRDTKRQPLAAGAILRAQDEISTGTNSRVLLRLGDGSQVKLGENARLKVSAIAQRREENLLTATLKVIEGAFRFTTSAALSARGRRNVSVQFPTVTVGIRGTDIWGKNLGDSEVVVLIEGAITISRAGDAPVEMKEPLTYLQAPRKGAASVQAVPAQQLGQWAAETEISPGHGFIVRGGRWKINLAEVDSQSAALAIHDRLRVDGYPVKVIPVGSGQRFRVLLSGLPSEKEAQSLAARIKTAHSDLEPKVAPLR